MNAVAPTMLSSSNVPHPEFAVLMAEQPLGGKQRGVLGEALPFMSRCCQSMLTLTLSRPCARSLWMTCSVMPTFRMRIFIAGSEFLCSRKTRIPCERARSAARPTPSTSHSHDSSYGVWKVL